MYISEINLENIGPLSKVSISFQFNGNGTPKPCVIVGENGAGKSILIAHLVNSLLSVQQAIFENTEVEKGKVYKYRSPNYIKSGEQYFYAEVKFSNGLHIKEWQLVIPRGDFEEKLGYTPLRSEWNSIPVDKSSHFENNAYQQVGKAKELIAKNCILYFPVNRFEEPAWLNYDNLISRAQYTELKHIKGWSNRNIISLSPLKANQNWLLDLIFDRQAFEIKFGRININNMELSIFSGYHGQSADIYQSIIDILKVILRENGNIRFGAGTRKTRRISLMKDEQIWVPNIFQLSSGETQLLNLFLTILRDFDLSEGSFSSVGDVSGIVIIDEVDAHLHTIYQKEVLPRLFQLFPHVQFIVTSHSPLFLLGLEETLGSDNINIIELPSATPISSSDFVEFVSAYNAFKETKKFREDISKELEQTLKPIVFVEGDYDIRYIRKASEMLSEQKLLSKINLKDGGGYGNLDKIWRSYDSPISDAVHNKIVLLYDCDTNKNNTTRNKIFKIIIPSIVDNPIRTGIENLFSQETISKIENAQPQYIDNSPSYKTRRRGQEEVVPQIKSVNKDEKGNLCTWICEHGEQSDFQNFSIIFKVFSKILSGEQFMGE